MELLRILPLHLFLDTPGRTEVVQYHITLKDPKPLCQPVYRLPILKKELEVMREMGVIEPSFSEWSSPKSYKKDGTLRFCLDFRKANRVSKLDLYPMPRIDDLVERIGGLSYISTLDLCKGY